MDGARYEKVAESKKGKKVFFPLFEDAKIPNVPFRAGS